MSKINGKKRITQLENQINHVPRSTDSNQRLGQLAVNALIIIIIPVKNTTAVNM